MLPGAVRLVLGSIGRSEEYEYYINKFRAADGLPLLLCPDRSCLAFKDHLRTELELLRELSIPFRILASGPWAGEMAQATLPEFCLIHPVLLPRALDALLPQYARLFFLRSAGGFTCQGKDILFYNTNAPAAIDEKDEALAHLGGSLLSRLPGLHIAVCAPHTILKEIFTVKGAGTVIRQASRVEKRAVDEELTRLIEQSFGRRLRSGALSRISTAYVVDRAGAILLEETPMGHYLSKFAVDTQARGSGVAMDLWEHCSRDRPSLFWRSRPGNSINRWYARLADGLQKSADWTVFWRGVPPDRIAAIIDFCLARPEDFDP
ncbi:MAG: hypothetical protein HS115_07705 [Spirochaetales bacterium]|nr:hypothetical protein [Spirochaetales bacterium]